MSTKAGEAGGAGRQGASPVCGGNEPQYTGEKQGALEGICWEQEGGKPHVPPPTVSTWRRGSKIHHESGREPLICSLKTDQ